MLDSTIMIEERLKSMGIILPTPPAPAGSYVPVVRAGDLLFISGQIPVRDGRVEFTGRVTDGTLEEARSSARLCAINVLAQARRETSLDHVRIVRLSGFVNAGPEFTMHPRVIDAASDFMHEVFGDAGLHSRIAVGVSGLPLDSMTEIDAVIQVVKQA